VLQVDFHDGVASFELKDKAEIWLKKILTPKSVLEKLGVKEESRVSVEGIDDRMFLKELKEKAVGGVSDGLRNDSDLIFFGAKTEKDLAKLNKVKTFLKCNGGLWIVSLKGKAAILKEAAVMAAGKKAGLVDTKVVGFSDTHTALKFVIPVHERSVVSKQ
jgi:bifunctional DNA-binding transcriptional regulator/antitoxin component of YhaV-PrlF toxin-antitoxin module